MMQRPLQGAVSHRAGVAAETTVERVYDRRGCAVVGRRWRGQGGEIDLIVRDGAGLVFVEVKHSRSHSQAAARVSPRQAQRIMTAAQEYLETEPAGLMTDIRFDVALVDGTGRVDIIENAFM